MELEDHAPVLGYVEIESIFAGRRGFGLGRSTESGSVKVSVTRDCIGHRIGITQVQTSSGQGPANDAACERGSSAALGQLAI